MRILVTGASGFIGKQLLKVLSGHAVTGTCFSRQGPGLRPLDLKAHESVRALLAELQPEAVVHCAARPGVDWCQLHPYEARETNLAAVIVLIEECHRLGSRLVFISTDYVFDGGHGPYSETDATNPINVYGRLKLEAEEAIHRRSDAHLIVRTTNVYGFDPWSKNFLMAALPELARGQRVRAANDQFGTPTTASDLCSVVAELITNQSTGTFHVSGPDLVTRAEWLETAARAFGLDADLVARVPTSELDQPAPRPKRSGLVSKRLGSALTTRLRSLEDGVLMMKKEWDEHQTERVGVAAARSFARIPVT